MWVSCRPCHLLQKRKPPVIGGLNGMKLGQHDIHHTAPSLSIKNPPVIGGNNPPQMRQYVDSTLPHSWKESPKQWGGIKKLEQDSVWDAHCLAGLWNITAGGRGHKCPPPHLWLPLSLSFPLFLPLLLPFLHSSLPWSL